jgi:hypothetical protein
MSMAEQRYIESPKKYMTRLAFSYEYKVPYAIVMDRVRRGELVLHFVDNRVQIDIEEALKVCVRRQRVRSYILEREAKMA